VCTHLERAHLRLWTDRVYDRCDFPLINSMASLPWTSYEVIKARLTGRVFFIASFIYQTHYSNAQSLSSIFAFTPSFMAGSCIQFCYPGSRAHLRHYQHPIPAHRPVFNLGPFCFISSVVLFHLYEIFLSKHDTM
jgi:hypothetical protein